MSEAEGGNRSTLRSSTQLRELLSHSAPFEPEHSFKFNMDIFQDCGCVCVQKATQTNMRTYIKDTILFVYNNKTRVDSFHFSL